MLVELYTRLGDDGAAAAPHTAVDICARGAVCALGNEELLWHPTLKLTHALRELCAYLVMME